MALILKNYTNEQGIIGDIYRKIDSIHNMGTAKNNKLIINYTEWSNAETRINNPDGYLLANKIDVLDVDDTFMQTIYELYKAYLQNKGIIIEDDMNVHNITQTTTVESSETIKRLK